MIPTIETGKAKYKDSRAKKYLLDMKSRNPGKDNSAAKEIKVNGGYDNHAQKKTDWMFF